jgi:hypothetical protein
MLQGRCDAGQRTTPENFVFDDLASPTKLAVTITRRNQRDLWRDRRREGKRVLQHVVPGAEFEEGFVLPHARALPTGEHVTRDAVWNLLHANMLHAAR